MKKALSIILCLVMVLSLTAVSISAAPKADEVGKVASGYTPEGTGIDSLDKITDPAGKYYLTKDITVSATYTTEFTGTFDGNGKKITTSVALFEKVNNATVMNFVVEGTVNLTEAGVLANADRKEDFYAAVAIVADGKSTFKNILADVDMTTTSSNTRIAAIAASSNEGYDLVFDTCVNKGDISVVKYAAGIYGWTAQAGTGVVKNCANYGNITSTGGYVGGVINRMCGAGGGVTVSDCANYGEVSSTGGAASGILAYHDKANLTITNCVNEAKINGAGGAGAGITANPALGDAGATLTIKNCVNKGAVFAKNQMGGIVGYSNTTVGHIIIEDCVNEAPITGLGTSAYGAGIIGRPGGDNAGKNESSVTVKNCVNKGDVMAGKDQVGGISGYDCMKVSTYENCVNKGKLGTIEGANRTQIGGIVANHRAGTEAKVIIKNCVNYADCTGLDHNAGGMMANTNVIVEMTNCVNYGNVTSQKAGDKDSSAGGMLGYSTNVGGMGGVHKFINCANYGDVKSDVEAGGIVGYSFAYMETDIPERLYVDIEGCINTGKVTGKAFASQMVAYTNSPFTTVKNNLAVGSVAGVDENCILSFLSGSTADLSLANISGNYIADADASAYFTYSITEDNAKNIVKFADRKEGSVIVATKAQLASGEVAYKLNAAIGKEVFKQTLGKDAVPSFEGKSVLKNVDGTYTNSLEDPTPSVPTGDISVIVFVIAVVTLGSAVVIGKKVSVR